MVGAAFSFACMSAAVKTASVGLPNTVVVFFRNAVALAILLPWLLKDGFAGLATRDVPGHLLRGIGGLLSMYCFFFALSRLRLADAVLLNQSMPLFLPLSAALILREPIPKGLWRALGVGFLGLALVVKPGLGVFSAASVVGLLSAVLAATAQAGLRRLSRTEPASRIVFYFALIATLGSTVPLAGTWRSPDPAAWPVLLGVGLFATLGQLLLTRAYSHAPAALIGPFAYTGVVFAGLLDFVFWRSLPDVLFVVGAVLVLVAGWMTLRTAPAPVTLADGAG